MNRFESLSKGRQFALALTVCILVIVTIAAIAEGVVRVRSMLKHGFVGGGIETLYHVDPESGLRVPIAGLKAGGISINSLGFRGPEIEMPKPEGTTRIAFMGASTTFSAEVSSNEATWPHLVVEMLKTSRPDQAFDYVNGGVPGYTVESTLSNLKLRVAPLQPDVIVIYHASNDLSGNSAEAAAAAGIETARADQGMSWLAKYSLLVYLVEKNVAILTRQRAAGSDQGLLRILPEELATPFRSDLEALVREAQMITDRVILVTFSTRLRSEQTPEEKVEAAVTALYYIPFFTPDDLIRHFEAYNQVIRDVARDTGAILIEGETDIPADSFHFVDSVHFSDAGSEVMARRVFDGLQTHRVF